jgi:hypothetical protein
VAAIGLAWGCGDSDGEPGASGQGGTAGGTAGTGGTGGGVGGAGGSGAGTASSVTQHGITWELDASYPHGQFVNGDHWVVGPIVVTAITQSSNMAERDGSMVNPMPSTEHGYDGRVGGYDPMLDVSGQLPSLALEPGTSLVSTISRVPEVTERAERRPALEVAAVLTVLDAPAPANSFRPPYAGTDKPLYSAAALQTERLLRLEPVASTPALDETAAKFAKPWIDNVLEWQGDDLHPLQNLDNYGAGISRDAGDGALRLLLDDSAEAKRDLLIGYVQLGIDDYGLVASGGNWGNVGGTIGVGRKIPILVAGLLLDDADLLNVAVDFDTRNVFQEDGQTFYLTQAERDGTYHADNCSGDAAYCHPGYYDDVPLGTACWGERHYRWLTSGYNYLPGKISYRALTHESTTGAALVVQLLGMQAEWNHDPFLDWTDRAKADGVTGTWGSQFSDDMWDAYR